jgi:hypothetical protein
LTHFGEHFSTESEDSRRLIEGLLHDLALACIFGHHVDVGAAEHNQVRHLRVDQYLASAECMHSQHSRAALLLHKAAEVRCIMYLPHVLALHVPAVLLVASDDADACMDTKQVSKGLLGT